MPSSLHLRRLRARARRHPPDLLARGDGLAEAVATAPAMEEREQAALDWITPVLVAVFVLSGAAGLIYQITWVRLLSLTFGVTIYAVSIVVATFMGGLALGSALGGRLADRLRFPILWYAFFELLIGVLGIKSIDALAWVQDVYLSLHPHDAEEAFLNILALRFALAAVVMLVPTTLMGATLPLMVRGSLSLSGSLGARVSWLYASNTTGAILGTLAAGFVLIGSLGIRDTIQMAALLNAGAAAPAFLLGLFARGTGSGVGGWGLGVRDTASPTPNPQTPDPKPRTSGEVETPASPMVRNLVIATFAVQGFASLAYEVVWTRVFAVLLDGSTYAFAIVLATVLVGIAAGSALVSPFISWSINWVRVYAVLQAGVALVGFLGILALARIYGITTHLAEMPVLGGSIDSGFGWMAAAAAVVILPVMLLLGASFPIAARIVVSAWRHTGRDLGFLYAGNTAGAILGAWAAGFLLLPALGSQRSIELLAGVNGLLAVALAFASSGTKAIPALMAGGVALAYMTLLFDLLPNMYERMLGGRFPGTEVVWVGEGRESTITVVRHPDTGQLDMYFNGQPQASDHPSVLWFHRLLGHLPMALHPDPQDVLIVGVGGGATASALARHEPRRLDIVELSEIAMEGAGYYRHVNGDILGFPSVQVKIDDGRNHLLLTDRRYDVVTADAIHPRAAGTALLYSYDYFKLVQGALTPNGMMAQWLKSDPEYPDNDDLRHLITRSFAAAFPYVTMWVDGLLLIGSNQPIDPRDRGLDVQWRQRDLGRILQEIGLQSPDAVRALYLLGDEEVRSWAGEGPLMTDDRPFGEFFLSLPSRL